MGLSVDVTIKPRGHNLLELAQVIAGMFEYRCTILGPKRMIDNLNLDQLGMRRSPLV